MNLNPNPFVNINQRQVFGIFKQLGSEDSDVIYAKKEEMISSPRNVRMGSNIAIVFFGLLSLINYWYFIGIPFLLFYIWLRIASGSRIKSIQDGYKQYCQSIGIEPT